MSKHPFVSCPLSLDVLEAKLPEEALNKVTLAAETDPQAFEAAAEDCILQRLKATRLLRSVPRHLPPLDRDERRARLKAQLGYWQSGCTCAIDEGLVADILRRRSRAA